MATTSTIRLSPYSVKQNLTNEEKHLICSTAKLEDYFQSIDEIRDGKFTTVYLGTSTGIKRAYPKIKIDDSQQDNKFPCNVYDPRFRGWYISAISGKKNIVFIIDHTYSHSAELETVKLAAKLMVGTFGTIDNIAVISLSDKVQSLASEQIVQSNSDLISQIQTKIDSLGASGSASYKSAFQKAFSMLEQSRKKEKLCCKQNQKTDVVFILFADGLSDSLDDNSTVLEAYIDSFTQFNVQMFPYSFSNSQLNKEFLQNLACSYNGRLFSLSDGASQAEIKLKIQDFYEAMAQGQSFDTPTFSPFYTDAFGFGRMNTITKPISYKTNSSYYLIGVAAIDIPVSSWTSLGITEQEAERRTKKYNEYLIKELSCENSTKPQFPEISGQVLRTPQTTETSKCCSLTTGGLAGLIVGLVILVAIIVGIVIYMAKRSLDNKNNKYRQQQQKNNIYPVSNSFLNS